MDRKALSVSNSLPSGFSPLLGLARDKRSTGLLVPNSALEQLKLEKEEAETIPAAWIDELELKTTPTQASAPVPVAAKTKPGDIQVFAPGDVAKANGMLAELDGEQQSRAEIILANASRNDGYRRLPKIKPAIRRLEQACFRFENLRQPLDRLIVELNLAGAMPAGEFRVMPILLAGSPGVGKTYLASQLADALGVPMEKWSAGSAQAAFQLIGCAPSWKQALPGMIYNVLAKGDFASPVLVLDEIDKMDGDGGYPVLPALLDLLDANSSRTIKDEYVRMHFDASKIIVIATANNLDRLPAPLLSRCMVFDVPKPGFAQRLRIIEDVFADLRRKTRRRIDLDKGSAKALAEQTDLDLRQTVDCVRTTFAQAMTLKQNVARAVAPNAVSRNRSIGFVQ